jgi:hypothetical protein
MVVNTIILFWEKIFFYGKAVAFTKHDLAKITHRSGEIKFGEKCTT